MPEAPLRPHVATESWIYFRALAAAGLKTSRWEVLTKDSGALLGTVSWFGRWRRYAFFPAPGTCFEQDCLRRLRRLLRGGDESAPREKAGRARVIA